MPITFSQLGKYGRISNQMFQAAATIALTLRNNDDYIFPHCDLENNTNIPSEKFSNHITFSSTYEEPHYHYAPISYKPNMNIHGYFQSYKYFNDFSNEIRSLLMPNVSVEYCSSYCFLHVRRTDYLIHHGCYNILTRQNYYDSAIEASGWDKFLIFSDDIKWCKENFKGNEFDFSEGNSPFVDMKMMTRCSGGIIANSSFSWWGAWLGYDGIKRIIAPKEWFGPKLSPTHDTKDLCPPEWIKV